MKATLVALSLVAVAGAAQAQGMGLFSSAEWRIGYFYGTEKAGQRIQGLDLGFAVPVHTLPGGNTTISIAPSVLFGGGLVEEEETDALISFGGIDDVIVYRILAEAKFTQPGQQFYGVAGIGFASGQPKASLGEKVDGIIGRVAIGHSLPVALGKGADIELGYWFGRDEFRGFSLNLGIRF